MSPARVYQTRSLCLCSTQCLMACRHRAQPERLADDEPVQREGKDQRLTLRLLQHFLELIDDHLAELAAGVIAMSLGRRRSTPCG